jgi:hypothetical protein
MERKRTALSLLLIVIGVGLLVWGLHAQIATVSSDASPQGQVAAASEFAITQEVARGGITRDESGELKKTYEGEKPPEACPT